MEIIAPPTFKYYLSYSGVKLPLNMVSPIGSDALENRNAYFRAGFDRSRLNSARVHSRLTPA